MFRLWGKIWQDTHLIKDYVYEEESDDTRTHKIFRGMDKFCYEFDIEKPMWLDNTIMEFKKHAKARFYKDSFIEDVPFDYLEIQIIEED